MRIIAAFVFLLATAHAQVGVAHWNCVDAAGKTVVADLPCPEGTTQISAAAKLKPTLATLQPKADWRSNGIPTWVWGIVGVLTLVWIKFLLPENLFRRAPKEEPPKLQPVVFVPPPPKPAPTSSRPAMVVPPAAPKPATAPAAAPAPAAPSSKSTAITATSLPVITTAESMPAMTAAPVAPAAAGPAPAVQAVSAPIDSWTPELISGLTLNKLETLVQRFWQGRGCEVARDRASDGAIQFLVSRHGLAKLFALAQCGPTKGEKIGLASVKALATEGVLKGAGITVFYSLPGFTDEAVSFVKDRPIKLISIAELVHEIGLMPPMQQQRLLEQTLITAGPALARS